MAEDWLADVHKYAPDADPDDVAGIVRYCGIALRNRDSSLVSFSSKDETARVRDNFLKKKLGLSHSDADLDKALVACGERMKGDRTKNRVTVYYLLARDFDRLHLFRKGAAAPANRNESAAGSVSTKSESPSVAASPPSSPAVQGSGAYRPERIAATQQASEAAPRSGFNFWPWLVLLLVIVAVILVIRYAF